MFARRSGALLYGGDLQKEIERCLEFIGSLEAIIGPLDMRDVKMPDDEIKADLLKAICTRKGWTIRKPSHK